MKFVSYSTCMFKVYLYRYTLQKFDGLKEKNVVWLTKDVTLFN